MVRTLDLHADLGQPQAHLVTQVGDCLLYTSDAADERSSVDLGGRRIINKKNKQNKKKTKRNLVNSLHYTSYLSERTRY